MLKNLLFILSLLLPLSLRAQNLYPPDSAADQFFLLQQLTGERYMDAEHKNEGMYLFEDWFPGRVLLASGHLITNISLRYNGYADELLWLKDKTVQIMIDKESIKEFSILANQREHLFRKLKINFGKDSTETFCESMYEGKVKVYVWRKDNLQSEIYRANMLYYIYVPKPVYCLFIGNKSYYLKNTRLKTLYAAVPQLEDRLRQRIREQHLKVRSEADFLKMIPAVEDILLDAK